MNDGNIGDQERDLRPVLTIAGDRSRFATPPLLSYEEVPEQLGDALRRTINRYELRTGEPIPKTIAVTSALPGEGVTTVSQALATVIAQEIGRSVCWVDCGWLNANSADPEDDQRPNLLELLRDESKLMSAFQLSPRLPHLVSLSPGPVPESKRNWIVRSPEFNRLLDLLADEVDHVVFDIPPVLTNSNGLALLRRSEASLIVVRHRSTTIGQLQRAMESTSPTPNFGVVLNRYRTRIPKRLRRLLGG